MFKHRNNDARQSISSAQSQQIEISGEPLGGTYPNAKPNDADNGTTVSMESAAADGSKIMRRSMSPTRPRGATMRSSISSAHAPSSEVASSISGGISNVIAPDVGVLGPGEEATLAAEIASRRAARRASKRRLSSTGSSECSGRRSFGTPIPEGHSSYRLMYNMLTGIRVTVGRISTKTNRELTDEDYFASQKIVFDITGAEVAPKEEYDYKFKDYAPLVFRSLRQTFRINVTHYLMSLTNKLILTMRSSPGKSGSFFYYSGDYRFIIKTIHHAEHKFLRAILKQYHQYANENPNMLLCRFYGLHRIKLPHQRKIHFVVMANVSPSNKDMHKEYDLKGSMIGRYTSEEEVLNDRHAVMKDQNWVGRHQKLELGPLKKSMFLKQLNSDVEFLMRVNAMDYSLLIGIHDLRLGNTKHVRDAHLRMVTPDTEELQRKLSTKLSRHESKASIVRKALQFSDPMQFDSAELLKVFAEERRFCLFYSEDGGFHSSNKSNQLTHYLYFMGLIDILTPYSLKKKLEHFWKSLFHNRHAISAVNAEEYGKRLVDFVSASVTEEST